MTEHYHWGQNIPGYLPMADELNTAATFDEARDGLLEDVDRIIDQTDQDETYEGSMLAAMHVAFAEIGEWEAPSVTYAASDRPHDLGLAFWVMACMEDECAPEADDSEDGHTIWRSKACQSSTGGYGHARCGGCDCPCHATRLIVGAKLGPAIFHGPWCYKGDECEHCTDTTVQSTGPLGSGYMSMGRAAARIADDLATHPDIIRGRLCRGEIIRVGGVDWAADVEPWPADSGHASYASTLALLGIGAASFAGVAEIVTRAVAALGGVG